MAPRGTNAGVGVLQVWDLNARKAKKPEYVAAARAVLART